MKIKTSKIVKNIQVSKDTYLLEFKVNFKFFPTQFLLIDTYPYRYLLKPFSIADKKNNILKILYRVISDGTLFLSKKMCNQNINFLGPFGNYKKIINLKITKNNRILFLGGGSGIASLIFLYKYFMKFTNYIKIFYGEKDKSYIVDLKKFFDIENVIYTTDNGTFGIKGFVTEVFKEKFNYEKPDYIFICGPYSMIKSLYGFLNNINKTQSFVIMEEYMCCGIGLCRSCVVKVKDKNDFVYKTICKDGPLFNLKDVIL